MDSTNQIAPVDDSQQSAIVPLSIEQIKPLSYDQWLQTVETTKQQIKDSTPEPNFADYLTANVMELPNWLSWPMVVCLVLFALFMLAVSAGKQLIASDLVFSDLLSITDRLSPFWLSAVLIILLISGEIGSLLFALCASLFPAKSSRIIFRIFSFCSAGIALLANITVTLSYPTHESLALQWFLTFFAPLSVLGVGLALENMLLKVIHNRIDAMRSYKQDYAIYRDIQRFPESHNEYKNALFRNVLSALRGTQATNKRKQYDLTIQQSNDFRKALFMREYAKHAMTIDLNFDSNGNALINPTDHLATI